MTVPATRADYRRTIDSDGEPTNTPQPKVLAATGGAVVGGAVSTIGIYAIETLAHIDLPQPVEGAILTLVIALCTFAGGWIKSPSRNAY